MTKFESQPITKTGKPAAACPNSGTMTKVMNISATQNDYGYANQARSVLWVLTSLSLAALLSSMGSSIANVGLPTLAQAFSASFQQVQWVVLAYLLAITTLIVSAGRIGDLFGKKRMLQIGITVFSIASVLCALAPTLGLLIAARMMQGLGAALMMSLAMALVGAIIPKEKIGSAMGILGTVSAIGTALGPSLGGLLIAEYGWPMIFLVNAPLGIFAWVLAYRFLPADCLQVSRKRPFFDAMGTLLLSLTLISYALAMTLGHGHFNNINWALLLAAGLGLGLFILSQVKSSSPLIRLSMFRNPALTAGFAMSTLVTTVVMATLVVGPFYLSGVLALDAAQIGLTMASGPIVAALAGAPAGRVVDRLGTVRITITGLIAMMIGTTLLSMLPVALGVFGYIIPLVILTAGYALFQAANNTAVMMHLSAQQRGVGSGLLGLSRNLGLITGASVMGMIFALGSGATDITIASPQDIEMGMKITFGIATALIVSALGLSLAGHILSRHDNILSPEQN